MQRLVGTVQILCLLLYAYAYAEKEKKRERAACNPARVFFRDVTSDGESIRKGSSFRLFVNPFIYSFNPVS